MAYGSKTSKGSKASTIVSKVSKKPLVKPLSFNQDMRVTGLSQKPSNFNPVQANSVKTVLNREVFNKIAFNNTVNTNFTELDQLPPDLSFFDPNLATVEDFFSIYQNLFFEIPKYGDINSHQYLVIESTEYSRVIENQEQIDALLEEITDLREQNLQLQLDINELVGVKETLDQAIRQSGESANLEDLLQQEAELGAAQSNSSSDLTVTSPSNTIGGFGGVGGTGIGAIQTPNFIIQSGAGAAEGLNPTLNQSLLEQQLGVPTVGMQNVVPINVQIY